MVTVKGFVHDHNEGFLAGEALDEGASATGGDDEGGLVEEEVELFGEGDEGDLGVGNGGFGALAVLDHDFGEF